MKRSRLTDAIVLIVVVAVIMGASIMTAGSSIIVADTFLDGSTFNGVDISGLTPEQAEQKFMDSLEEQDTPAKIDITCEGKKTTLTEDQLGRKSEVQAQAHEKLFALTEGTASEKMDTLLAFSHGVNIDFNTAFDREVIKASLDAFAKQFNVEPVDAKFELDEMGDAKYIPEVTGTYLDTDEATIQVHNQLVAGKFDAIDLKLKTKEPGVKVETLKENVALLKKSTTDVTNIENRNHNIDLICKVVNGQVVQPNETISLNKLTGPRGEGSEYKIAPAIVLGEMKDDYGGGVCQLASTLYEAALYADMEIVERNRHSWASSYTPEGMDATIDYDSSKDLILKNVSDQPMYIFAARNGDKLNVSIYGKKAHPDYEVDIERDVLATIAPGDPVYVYDSSLSSDQQTKESDEHLGMKVQVYRNYSKDGEVVEKERISSDTYQPVKAKYRTGNKSAAK